MSEENVPQLISNRFDLKALTINLFGEMVNAAKNGEYESISLSGNTNSRAIIITNFAFIESDISSFTDKNWINDLLVYSRNKVLVDFEAELGDKARLTNDSSMIILKNAIVQPFANPQTKINMDQIVLFSDQVVGFTLGSF